MDITALITARTFFSRATRLAVCALFSLASFQVESAPGICVMSEVACFMGTNGQGQEICGTFGKSVTGVETGSAIPAFCYRFTITNCGTVALTNVTVVDDRFGNLTLNFFPDPSTELQAGTSIARTLKVELSSNTTNTVFVDGQNVLTGEHVGAFDSATARLLAVEVFCTVQVSNTINDISLPDESYTLVWRTTIFNLGLVNLNNVMLVGTVTTGTNIVCTANIPPFSLAAGSSLTIPLCTNEYVCMIGNNGSFACAVTASSSEFTATNQVVVCARDGSGNAISVRSDCIEEFACILAAPIVLSRGSPVIYNSPTGFVAGPTLTTPCGTLGQSAKWFRLQKDLNFTNGIADISTEGTEYDTILAAYRGSISSATNLSLLACNDDISAPNKQSRIAFKFPPSIFFSFYLVVDSRGNTNNKPLVLTTGYAPTIESYGFLPPSQFRLRSSVAPSLSYQLQASTNPDPASASWTGILTTNLSTNFPYVQFNDASAAKTNNRYYRIVKP